MSDEMSQVVEVYVSRETAQIDTASFDIPLLLVNLPDTVDVSDPENPVNVPADVTNRVQEFRDITEVADVFGTDSAAYKMAVKLLGGDIRPARFMIGIKNSEESYAEATNAVLEYNNDWYILAIESKVEADIKAVAEIIQATRKMFGASTADVAVTDPASTTDLGTFLRDTGYDRTFLVYHTQAVEQFPEVAWIGGQIAEVPGSNNWAFKGGAGVTVDRLSSTAVAALDAKKVNYFTRLGGVNLFRNGTTSEGTWIDVVIFLDWWAARVQEQVFYRVATKKKIPMTNAGAMIVEAEIRSVNTQGIANGGIADSPQPVVISPNVLDIPEVQRGQRTMGDFLVQFRLAGAANKFIIRATVSY